MKIFDPKLTGSIEFQNPVQGNIEITGDLVVPGSITAREFKTEFVSASIIYQSGSTQFGDTADDTHIFTGNVGIGSSTPSAKLHVEIDDASEVDLARFRTINGADNHFLDISVDNTNNLVAYDSSGATAGAHVFRRGGTEVMRIGADGSIAFSQGASTIPVGGISHYTNNYLYIKGGTAGGALGNDNFSSAFYALDNGDANIIAGTSNALVVKASGNVGIGTTDPQAVLHLHGNTQAWTTSPTIVMSSSNTGNANVRNWRIGPADTNFGNFHIGVSDTQGGIVDSDAEASTFTIDYTGNVGIGTVAPNEKLHVNGNIRVEGTGNRIALDTTGGLSSIGMKAINDYEAVLFNDRGSAGFAVIGNSNIRLGFGTSYTAVQSSMLIQSTGNVGIGTTSPGRQLHLYNTGDAWFRMTGGGADFDFLMDGNLRLFNSTGEVVRVDSNGYVGIGNTSPQRQLVISNGGANGIELDSNISGQSEIISYNRSTSAYTPLVLVASKFYFQNADVGIAVGTPGARLDVAGNSAGDPILRLQRDGVGSYDYFVSDGGDGGQQLFLRANTADSGFIFQPKTSGGSNTSAMMINPDGKVGIGTTSPSYKLVIRDDYNGDKLIANFENRDGNVSTGAYIGFSTGYAAAATIGAKREGAENDSSLIFSPMFNEVATERMRITSTGVVQIGTDVSPAITSDLFISRGDQYGFHIDTQNGFTKLIATDDNLYLGTGGSTDVTIDSNGNVGINKTSPDYKLDVEGRVAFTDEIMARSGTASITNADYVTQGKWTGNGVYIHLKTNLGWGANTQMYSWHFYGYSYGEAKPVDAMISFYNYPPSGSPINVGNSGTHSIILYQSTDGYIVVRIQFANSYYTGLTMSARNTAQGVAWPSITATAQNGTSNHF